MNQVREETSLHYYRTEIPNIIFEMGLTPYELSAYCHLKRTAGDGGQCFKTCQRLSDEIGCHKSKFIEIKKSLESKGLIRIEHRKKEDGGSLTDIITIVDLWPRNMQLLSEKRSKANTPVANGDPPPSPMATPPVANGDPKKNTALRRTPTTTKSEVVVPSYIQEIEGITDVEKLDLLKFPEDRIKLAIEFNRIEKPTTTKIQQLVWHCQRDKPPEPKKKNEDLSLENKKLAEEIEKKYVSKNCRIEALNKYIEFVPSSGKTTVITYEDKGFREQVENALYKNKFVVKKRKE